MSEARSRPVGMTILSWLFIAGGIAGALAVLAWLVRSGRMAEGLPLEVIGGVLAAVFLGVVAGTKMLQGAVWTWVEATSLCALAVGFGGFAAATRWGHPALGPGVAALGLIIGIYLLSGGVGDFFGIPRRKRWALFVTQLALCSAVVLVVYLATGESVPESPDSSQLLHALGDDAASTDKDVEFMLERLENGNDAERVSAAWALGRSGRADAVPALLLAAGESSSTDVRINAIASLAALGGPEIEPDLLAFLDDADAEIRAAGLRGLADEKFTGAAGRVGRLLVENEELRAAAADALGRMGNPEAVPYLQQAAKDPDEDIRTRVAFALGKIADANSVSTLIELLQDEQWTVRANAAQALGMIGDPSARAALESLRDDRNSSVRAASEAALEKLP